MKKTAIDLYKVLIPAIATGIGVGIGTMVLYKNEKNNNLLELKRIESNERIKIAEIESNERIKMSEINKNKDQLMPDSSSGNNKLSDSSMFIKSPNESNDNFFMDYINSFIEYINSLETIELYSMSILIFAFIILWCLINIFIDGFIYNNLPENVDKFGKLNKYIVILLNLFKSTSRGISYYNLIIICISLLFIILESAYMLFK